MANKRNAIIDATIKRIAKDGDSFSTEDVATDVDCSKTLIFMYFKSKDNLIEIAFKAICHDIRTSLGSVDPPMNPDRESIVSYMVAVWDAYFDYIVSNSDYAKAYITCISKGHRYPSGYDTSEAIAKKILGDHADYFACIDSGSMLKANYIIMIAYGVAQYLSSGIPKDVDDLKNGLKDIILHGII